jgi:hypothetical protein
MDHHIQTVISFHKEVILFTLYTFYGTCKMTGMVLSMYIYVHIYIYMDTCKYTQLYSIEARIHF